MMKMPSMTERWAGSSADRRLPYRTLALCACLVLSGCGMFQGKSRDEALKELAWNYAQDGIRLNVQADPMLNATAGQPHMLLLVLAQMEDPNAFAAYARQPERLAELLLAETAPEGILDVQRFHIAPDSQREVNVPRVQSARYVGIAAGYAQLESARSARLYQIGVAVDRSGWVVRDYSAAPEALEIRLRLGPEGIQDSLSMRAEDTAPVQPESGLVEFDGPFPAPVIAP